MNKSALDIEGNAVSHRLPAVAGEFEVSFGTVPPPTEEETLAFGEASRYLSSA